MRNGYCFLKGLIGNSEPEICEMEGRRERETGDDDLLCHIAYFIFALSCSVLSAREELQEAKMTKSGKDLDIQRERIKRWCLFRAFSFRSCSVSD